jgi:ketosteroid isomerase-like protein
MSQQNVEIVRSIYDSMNRGDWEAAFRDAHPDFEMTIPPGPFNAGTHRGRANVQAVLDDYFTAFEAWFQEPEEFFESDAQVVAFVKIRVRPRGGGVDLKVRNGHLWTIRDGTVLSLRVFPEPEKALDAAGLRE